MRNTQSRSSYIGQLVKGAGVAIVALSAHVEKGVANALSTDYTKESDQFKTDLTTRFSKVPSLTDIIQGCEKDTHLMDKEKTQNLSAREKFVSLANKRVSNAAKFISLIGNLSDKSNYLYTDQDARKIFSYLKRKLNGNLTGIH